MGPKIFLTGVTGYIGGDAFHTLSEAHPEYEFSLLVRSKAHGETVKGKYQNVRIVQGQLDDYEVIKHEASEADIVLHTADSADHEGSAKAIAAGLLAGHSKERPGYWLHTGGTGILTYTDSDAGRLGEWDEKEYNDWDGVTELTHLPDHAFHRNVDKIVLQAGSEHGDAIKTALVCPPTIYGEGHGPVSGRSRQVYTMASLILTEGYIPIVGRGKARHNNVHIRDLSNVFLRLAEAAVAKKDDAEMWGSRGYYLTVAGEHQWGKLAEQIAEQAYKMSFIKEPRIQALSKDSALQYGGYEAVSWGLNSRGKGERANRVLGWTPTARSLEDEIPILVKSEFDRLST